MKAAERVAKWEAAVASEQAEIERLNAELRKFMSQKNPRARDLRRRRDQAAGRLYTAKQRLAAAAEAAA